MNIGDLIAKLFADQTMATAIYGIVVLAVLDFATGTLRAIADKSFEWNALDVWVRGKVAGRLVPLILVLLAGEAAPDLSVLGLSVNILMVTGLAGAATFAATELASIVANLNMGVANPTPSDNLTLHPR